MPPACFIIGTERSGSNLVRMLLTSHPGLAVPHPPHLVRYLLGLPPLPFDEQVDAARTLLETHVYPWEVPIDWDAVRREATPRDPFGIQYALYDQYAAAHHKPRWCCKSTFMVAHVPTVHAHHPEATFVWLFRDPRDVAVSSRKSVFSATHPVHVAELWRDQQRQALAAERELPDRVFRLRYEDLVASPETTVRALCDAIGVPFEPVMLDFAKTDEARRSAALSESWAKTGEAVSGDGVGRWKGSLTPEQIGWIEGICGEEMRALAYPLTGDGRPPTFTAGDHARFRREALRDELLIEWRSFRRDKNVWKRWRRAWVLRGMGWRG